VPKRPTDYLVAPTIRLDKGEGLAEALRCQREFDPRVFLIFGGDAEDVLWLHETLEANADHPILFCADLERGAGQQFEGLTPLPDAWALGLLGMEAAYDAGQRTAAEAAQANVRWVLGPVLDLHRTEDPTAVRSPIVGNRAFGSSLQRIIECGKAFAQGVTDGGGIPCGKHFPGHGGCAQDSHTEMAICFEELEPHLAPFKACLDALPSIMVAHVEYPMFDPEGRPASRSKPILDILRNDWNYDGVIVTDGLRMAGLGDGPHDELAMECIQAGSDLLLDPEDPVTLALTLRDAMERGDLDEARVRQSVERIDKLIAFALNTEAPQPKPLVLGAGTKVLLHPLPGGTGGRKHVRPGCALNLAATPDAINYLEEWGVPVLTPDQDPPCPLPDGILILWGAANGRGLPDLPSAWLEAIHHERPRLYVAGSPDAIHAAPASARGWYVPGLSPALLGMLITADASV
jgi:beta-glucosidase-like glycosyl hydrolase